MAGILIIAEHRQGALRPVTAELVAGAQPLRAALGGRVQLVVVGKGCRALEPGLAIEGVDEIVFIETPEAEFDAETWERAVAAACTQFEPRLVLVSHGIDSMGFAPALALRCGYGFATDVFGLAVADGAVVATRAGYGGKVVVELGFRQGAVLLTLRPGTYKPASAAAAAPAAREFVFAAPASRTRNLRFIEPPASGDIDMTAADFILSVGRGVGEQDHIERFRALTDRIGFALGCSRPVADSGWLPKSRQIGQSGRTASQCKLYIAMGISGAIQHLAGMKHVDTIIAVNTDPNASIFSVARYGVVGDMFEIADELEKQFE
ncbi:MAG: electron transfer flavoprotein subunit alpha/FixB family protein [Burkholderiales bacterium]|nr:electron transfer flavoprotein subunit alpha/FixB family protein [Burkholderiales bacterium]MDE1925850.1 electron transfer flavoprotein subunit alpha/FixB family protein [Burkholderiales bacterium]MDE2159458.1 electron transfer flavoprotein subunit alpha/FixB family protein [Burkholderiales bacterium]MDE2503061.1 electron transfer flavoprotein subunit alpha/FixB family protein [Burkholderiales bacterium]